ncbi:response regulator transcription factor [Actinomadura fibrosa]|uniref:Response regulator transcription factor n=1 Tax=Actinomadura fibrosa TaxID=111802 RepID=A0ABW2XMP0_9ACTN|nr:response regulator transcription factor [Actinomadura fibrosa]
MAAPSRPAGRDGRAAAHRLLIAEDDRDLAELLAGLFAEQGYAVDLAFDGQRALHLALGRRHDAMIVDRGLPDGDGVELVRRLRRRAVTVPVLVLSARSAVADRVAGLDAGAEDYVVKPFEIDELMARVRALHRRHLDHAGLLPLGAGWFDAESRVVELPSGERIPLSEREGRLLRALACRPRHVHTRDALRQGVFDGARTESIVDTYVYYLRSKLGQNVVRTVRGVGYRVGEL